MVECPFYYQKRTNCKFYNFIFATIFPLTCLSDNRAKAVVTSSSPTAQTSTTIQKRNRASVLYINGYYLF